MTKKFEIGTWVRDESSAQLGIGQVFGTNGAYGYDVRFKGFKNYPNGVVGHLRYGDELSVALTPVDDVPTDAVTPDHYKFGDVRVMDIVKYLPFPEGNVIKYVARAARKGNELEDLRKAEKYIKVAIEVAEAKANGRDS